MVSNIYALLDFWLGRLAKFHHQKANLPLAYRDIRGRNDLDAYGKYFTRVARLSLESVEGSFGKLDDLRKVRNRLLHHGGHVESDRADGLRGVAGVSVLGSLVRISDDFIWSSLHHAKVYLLAVSPEGERGAQSIEDRRPTLRSS